MQQTLLAGALALALSATISSAASAPSDHGRIPLDALEYLLGGEPPSATARARGDGGNDDLLWFTDQALTDGQNYAAAVAAYRSGKPVAVLRGPVTADMDRTLQGVFGVASSASLAVYVRDAAGGPHIHGVAELPETRRAQRRVAAAMARGAAETARKAAQRATEQLSGEIPDDAAVVALPQLVYVDTQYASSGNGSSVTVRGEVIRDSGRSYDVLVVSGSSTHTLKPHHNGQSGASIIVPGMYTYYLRLSSIDNSGTEPKLTEFRPLSSTSTDIQIKESHTVQTSYGFGLNLDISKSLSKEGPSVGAKVGGSFNFTRNYSTTNELAFSVTDYSIATGASRPLKQSSKSYWELPLASAIASRPDYFGKSPSPAKMTPMMRQASAQGSAKWTVPGTFDNFLTLAAGADISNREFTGTKVKPLPDPRPQPTAGVSVPANSPYLTREATVFIQSMSGNGGCLRDGDGTVRIAECPDTSSPRWAEDLHAQWQLDSNGRYYNRGSQRCMQILTSGTAPGGYGEIILRPCTTNRDQRWEWQIDRIHTLHGDGYPRWRLFVDTTGRVRVRTEGYPEHQLIPLNPYHPLLKPWSSYPAAPGSSDFIPKLENIGPNEPVSDEVKKLKASPPQERWELIVLRQSLHR